MSLAPTLARFVPFVALALGLAALALYLWAAVRRAGLGRRPVLFAAVVLAAGPVLHVGLVWGRVVTEIWVRFARPWATPIGAAAMAFVAWRLSARGSRFGRARTLLGDGLLAGALVASALGVAGPELGRPLDRLAVVVLVDRSRSIDLVPQAEQRVTRELAAAEASMRPDDLVGTVVFGAAASTEEPLRRQRDAPLAQRLEVGRDATDIALGLRRALAEVPADAAARIVLVSDGVETRGDALAAAAAAVAADVPVDVLGLEQHTEPDLRVVALRMPARASEGEALELRLVVSSPADADIEVRLKRDGRLLRRLSARVAAGEDVLRIVEKAEVTGLVRYDVELSALDPALDATPDDNAASAFVRVSGPARALVIDGEGKTRFLGGALEAAGFRVEEGRGASVPTDVAGMASFDLIAFGDVPAHDLAPAQIEALASYVRDLGGGLLLLGGDRSMGPGGYARTAVEEVAPVSFDLKQEHRRASLAQVIAIDISGSMGAEVGGHTKLELANEGASRTASLLGAGDHLGVVHVDTAPRWSVRLAPVRDAAAIDRAIRAVKDGGGGIFVDVALREAYVALRGAKVNLKHVLLFADGADAENIDGTVRGWAAQAKHEGITTSVVSLGQGDDVPDLEAISRLGGGRFYIVEDAQRLPAIFTQETVIASRSALSEEPFRPTLVESSPVIAGVDLRAAPALQGYVVTVPKPGASVLLAGPERDPVLSVWQAGLGRAAAFTSDLKDRWGAGWTDWPGAARLAAQLARDLARRADDRRVRLAAEVAGAELYLRATVVDDDGRLESFRRLRASVHGPDGIAREVPLEASGAGSYGAVVSLTRPGAYVAVARDELSAEAVATAGGVLGTGEELRPTGSDHALLARIAELTGGKRRDTIAGIFLDRGGRRFAYRDVTGALAGLAAVALLLAVGARRLTFPAGAGAWMLRQLARLRTREERPAAPGGATAEATLAMLLRSKHAERARGEPSAPTTPANPPRPPPPPFVAAPLAAPVVATLPPMAAAPAPAPPTDTAPGGRPLTAAEILLERRRGRRH